MALSFLWIVYNVGKIFKWQHYVHPGDILEQGKQTWCSHWLGEHPRNALTSLKLSCRWSSRCITILNTHKSVSTPPPHHKEHSLSAIQGDRHLGQAPQQYLPCHSIAQLKPPAHSSWISHRCSLVTSVLTLKSDEGPQESRGTSSK